jgi:hypothetical protein
MPHRKRVLPALIATLGLVLATLALTPPAAAGGQITATLDLRAESGVAPIGGTLSNGVGWTLDKGIAGSPAGALIGVNETQTVTFDRPVSVVFSVSGLNCVNEGMDIATPVTASNINPNHTWDPATQIVRSQGAALDELSFFTAKEPVTSITATAVSASGCFRGLATFEVSFYENQTPTVSIAAPIDGGVFTQGQTLLADYSCADADTVHVDAVTCVGNVADGSPIDTSTTGAKSFTVTATDEHGATSDQTVAYTVGDQAGLCSATAIGLPHNLDLGVANGGLVPCTTRDGRVADFTLFLGALPFPLTAFSPSVKVSLAEATSTKAGNTHKASTRVAGVKISFPLNSWSLEFKDLWSEVSASTPVNCAAGNDLQGTVEIGRIIRNGTTVHNQLDKPLSIPLPLVGGVYLNHVATTGTRVTADVLAIDLPGEQLDITIGHSTAGVDC